MTKLTFKASVLKHMQSVGSISIREAMDDYGMSGGSLTKYISVLKAEGHNIHKEVRKHPITGRKYARYHLVDVYKKEDVTFDKVTITTDTRNVYPFRKAA